MYLFNTLTSIIRHSFSNFLSIVLLGTKYFLIPLHVINLTKLSSFWYCWDSLPIIRYSSSIMELVKLLPADIADKSVCRVEKNDTSEVGVEVFPVFLFCELSGVLGFFWTSICLFSLICFFALWLGCEVGTSRLRLTLLLSALEDLYEIDNKSCLIWLQSIFYEHCNMIGFVTMIIMVFKQYFDK